MHEARHQADALIINPAGYSFTSIALFDALKTFSGPIIELHISNIHAEMNCIVTRYCPRRRRPLSADWARMATFLPCRRPHKLLGKLTDRLPPSLRGGPAMRPSQA